MEVVWCSTQMQAIGTTRMEVGVADRTAGAHIHMCTHIPTQYCFFFFTPDFDEKCSKEDDWDVDLAGYYSYGEQAMKICIICTHTHPTYPSNSLTEGADKDACDLRDMQIQERLRDHGEELLDSWKIGQFEKHTKVRHCECVHVFAR